jgi:CRP-like cAMP-binding protein
MEDHSGMTAKDEIYEFNSRVLLGTKLFKGLDLAEINEAISLLPHEVESFNRGEILVSQGDKMPGIGIVLEGTVKTAIEYSSGDDSTTRRYDRLEVMGLVVASSETQLSPFIFSAEHACTILWIDYWHIRSPKISALPESLREILHENAQNIHADLTIRFSGRTRALEQRTCKKKIMYFFHDMAGKQRSTTITLTMTQPKLAEYLGMERATLTRTLSYLEKEGRIRRYKDKKTTYTICDEEED